MPAIQINTPFNIALDFEVAPLHKRILAYLADLVVLVIYAWGMRVFLHDMLEINRYDSWYGVDILLVSIPMLLYAFICEVTMQGQSLGKKLLGIRVMSLEGGQPDRKSTRLNSSHSQISYAVFCLKKKKKKKKK